MDSDLFRKRNQAVKDVIHELTQIIRMGIEAFLKFLVAPSSREERPRRQIKDNDQLVGRAVVQILNGWYVIRKMLENVATENRIKGSIKSIQLIERSVPESIGVTRVLPPRFMNELLSCVYAEIVQIGPSFANEIEHHACSTADVKD